MAWHRTTAVLPSIPVAGGYGIYSREFPQKTLVAELVVQKTGSCAYACKSFVCCI